ncbi:MAG: DsbA family protein [Patescibacteria group bacterium]|jgi:protein-disulfide isomerase|nr:DsbA family protein [Patescibacteria group bacterium]
MYSQNDSFIVPPSADNKPKKSWLATWWGRLIMLVLTIFLIILVAILIYIFKLAFLLQSGQFTNEDLFGTQKETVVRNDLPTMATADDPSFGPKDAKVVIVEFSDFQCPYCYQTYEVLNKLKKDYGGLVLVYFRDFPLTDIHPQALLAAMGGECAHEQGAFWGMHDKIFANQADITEEALKRYALQLGLNSMQFNNCLTSGKYLDEIEQDLNEGYNAGVRATPTFFVNGQLIRGVIPYTSLESIIQAELGR